MPTATRVELEQRIFEMLGPHICKPCRTCGNPMPADTEKKYCSKACKKTAKQLKESK